MFDALTSEERLELHKLLYSAYKQFRKLERYVQRYTSRSYSDESLSSTTTEMVYLLTDLS